MNNDLWLGTQHLQNDCVPSRIKHSIASLFDHAQLWCVMIKSTLRTFLSQVHHCTCLG